MTWYREWFGEEYLDLYSYRDEREAKQHVEFFQRHIGRVEGPVLDLACGNGRHMQELRAQHYAAVGCDLSHVLLRSAQDGAGELPLVRADMRRLAFRDGSFHALVNFFTSFGYFENEEDNADVVREMSRVLQPRAPFVFDFMNVHRELSNLVQKEEKEIDGGVVRIERWFDAAARTFNKRIIIGERRFMERVRGYDLDEISALFAANGLVIGELFGDFESNHYDEEAARLIVIGTRQP